MKDCTVDESRWSWRLPHVAFTRFEQTGSCARLKGAKGAQPGNGGRHRSPAMAAAWALFWKLVPDVDEAGRLFEVDPSFKLFLVHRARVPDNRNARWSGHFPHVLSLGEPHERTKYRIPFPFCTREIGVPVVGLGFQHGARFSMCEPVGFFSA